MKKFICNIHFTNSLDFLKAILYSSKLQSTYEQAYLSQSPSRLAAFTEKLRQSMLIVYFTKGQKTYRTLLMPQKSSIFAVGSNHTILIEYPLIFIWCLLFQSSKSDIKAYLFKHVSVVWR